MFKFQLIVLLAALATPLAAADQDGSKKDSPKPAASRKIAVLDVNRVFKNQHLAVVLNADLDEINGDNPTDVARAISNKVVWFDDSIDLTPQLERNYARCPVPAEADKRPSLAAESNERAIRPAQAELPAILPHAASRDYLP